MIRGCCSGVHVRVNTACGLKRTFETSALDVWACRLGACCPGCRLRCDLRFNARVTIMLDHAWIAPCCFVACPGCMLPLVTCGGLWLALVACGYVMTGRKTARLGMPSGLWWSGGGYLLASCNSLMRSRAGLKTHRIGSSNFLNTALLMWQSDNTENSVIRYGFPVSLARF